VEKEVYVVTGATGNIGKALAEKLLAAGCRVRVIGRSQERLRSLKDKGAESLVGSLDDADFLTRAFEDARVVFTMIPPNPTAEDFRSYQNLVGEALCAAIERAGVTHVVNLSSMGGHLAQGTGPIKGLYDNEQRLNRLPNLNVVHLRPTFFMENLLMGIEIIKQMGVNGGAARADTATPMIATKDIAAAAAQLMLNPTFEGKQARELLGPRDYTMVEATTAIGKAIGRENLQYLQVPYEVVRQAMVGQGLSANVADELIELARGANEGLLKPTETRSTENTTPTTLEEFAAETFAPAYNAGSAAQSS
jgi:uncharacterized protein YbjT (DUF2867 family)